MTPPRLRADAAANRAHIVEVARQTFAADGLDVPMSEIARRAGLGIATVYRRFPTKGDLVAEAFAEQMDECARLLDTALADPDPWRAVCRVIEDLCVMQARDHGFSAAIVTALPGARFRALRQHAERTFAELIRRAQAAGTLRTDFVPADLPLILLANGSLLAKAGEAAPAASRRLAAYLLQSFRAEAAAPLPPPPDLSFDVAVL